MKAFECTGSPDALIHWDTNLVLVNLYAVGQPFDITEATSPNMLKS
jgi:hypothetical protein